MSDSGSHHSNGQLRDQDGDNATVGVKMEAEVRKHESQSAADAAVSKNHTPDITDENTPKYVTVYVRGLGEELLFRLRQNTRLGPMMQQYAKKRGFWGQRARSLRFFFAGEQLNEHHRVSEFPFKDGDEITVLPGVGDQGFDPNDFGPRCSSGDELGEADF